MIALQSLVFAGACAMGFALLAMAPRWIQVVLIGLGIIGAVFVIGEALVLLDGGLLLGALMLLAGLWGLDAVLVRLRQPESDSPSMGAPGGADAPGAHGERDGERHAPSLPSGLQTAGCAGRPRSLSEVAR